MSQRLEISISRSLGISIFRYSDVQQFRDPDATCVLRSEILRFLGGFWGFGFRESGVPRFRDFWISRFGGSRSRCPYDPTPRPKDPGFQGCGISIFRHFGISGVPRFRDFEVATPQGLAVSSFRDIEVSRFRRFRILGFWDFDILGFPG